MKDSALKLLRNTNPYTSKPVLLLHVNPRDLSSFISKEIMTVFWVVVSALVGFSFMGCERQGSHGPPVHVAKIDQIYFPISVSVVRDGKSRTIKYRALHSAEPKVLWLVNKTPTEKGWNLYLNESWDEPGAKPLEPYEALKCMSEVESVLRNYYGDAELKKIVGEAEYFNSMTVDDIKKRMGDPIFGDRFEANNAMQLIGLFREHVRMMQK